MKTNLTAVFKLALKGRRTLKDSSHQKIKAIGDKEDSHIVVSYKYSWEITWWAQFLHLEPNHKITLIDQSSSVSLSYSVFGVVTGSWFHDNGAPEEQYLPNTFSEADIRTEKIAFNDGTFNSLSICLEEHQ